MAAIKMTMDLLSKFHYEFYALNFDNWHYVKLNWSLQIGVQMFVFNFLAWTSLGIIIDFIMHCPCKCVSKIFTIKVRIENDNENVLLIAGLKERNNSSQ